MSADPDVAMVSRIGAVPTILKVVSEVTGLRLALVARVTPDAWTACAVLDRMGFGLAAGDHLEVATTLCSEVRAALEPIVIEHASADPDYCTHHTPKLYGIESYIAVPIIRPNGEYFGNVCALDAVPAKLRDGKTIGMMRLFAELIALQLADEESSGRDRAALVDAQQTAELREQFIAVLGHDLRNPLSSIVAGSAFLLDLPQEPAQQTILGRIRGSAERMSRLIDDIMDFARGRLGGGMVLTREPVAAADVVRHVVAEIASAHGDRTIRETTTMDPGVVWIDRMRVAQMLSNLVANAVEHGAPAEAVDVSAAPIDGAVRFAVTSRGATIPEDVMPHLFQPYVRGSSGRPRAGLGLGLHIASEIARAHGGSIGATSSPDGVTTFTVDVPHRSADVAAHG